MRHAILEGLGWKLLRIWSTDYFINPVRIIDEIDRQLTEYLEDYRMAKAEEEKDKEKSNDEIEDEDIDIESTEVTEGNSSTPVVPPIAPELIENIDSPYVPLERKQINASPYIYYSGPKCSDPHDCNESGDSSD